MQLTIYSYIVIDAACHAPQVVDIVAMLFITLYYITLPMLLSTVILTIYHFFSSCT